MNIQNTQSEILDTNFGYYLVRSSSHKDKFLLVINVKLIKEQKATWRENERIRSLLK